METSKRKKNILFITILSVVGLIGAMALQMIWIYNSYELIRNDILNEGYATIEKALEEEGNMRFGQTPKGTKIMSGPTNDTIPPMTYFYERLSDMGYPMSLHNLDSITAELLTLKGLGNQYYIDIINLRTGEKINGIGTQKEPSFMAVKPKYFPIRSDYTQVVQLIITRAYGPDACRYIHHHADCNRLHQLSGKIHFTLREDFPNSRGLLIRYDTRHENTAHIHHHGAEVPQKRKA